MIWFPIKLSLRRFFYLVIMLAILLAGTILWLSQLDFNQYRDTLEQQLSQMLEQPVKIGNVSLAFSRGLALEVSQLRIGHEEMPLATVPIMMATLELEPLLDRRIVFHDISLRQPQVNLLLPEATRNSQNLSPASAYQLPDTLSINRLNVSDAELNIYCRKNNQIQRQVKLTNLQANVSHLQPQRVADILITGQLKDRNTTFLLETTLPPRLDPQQWRHNNFQTHLTVRHLETKGLLNLENRKFPRTVDLQVNIDGVPVRGARVTTSINGSQTAEQLIALSGFWSSDDQSDQLTQLSGNLLGVPLEGQIILSHNDQVNHLQGKLGIAGLELTPALLKRWRVPHAQELIAGQIKQLQLSLDQRWSTTDRLTRLPRVDAAIDLVQLQWQRPEIKYLQDFSANLTLQNQQLQIQNGLFHLNNNAFNFRGHIEAPFKNPKLSLILTTRLPSAELEAQDQWPETLKIAGEIPLQLQLNGPPSGPAFTLKTDLTPVAVNYAEYFTKPAGENSQLLLSGTVDASQLNLDQVKLTLNQQSIIANGSVQRSDPTHHYSVTIDDISLKQLSNYSAFLQQLQVEGKLGGSVTMTPEGWQGTLRLNGFGAHLTSLLGKLRNTTGTINLNSSGMTFHHLAAGLGESQFLVSGTLSDWSEPSLSLDVSGSKIRAHDLIFLNEELTLYDLVGHLLINGDGIRFDPVDVRLEEGTVAHVTGSVTNFRDPEVKLDISGEKVDVLDVINLFIGPDKAPQEHPEKTNTEYKPIIISVHADQGIIRGFRFQNASGLITETHERFVLAPLTFDNGNGAGTARVVFDRTDAKAPLKISGHVNQIDASVLHQDLFEKPGLITGDLDGDFYIEGDPGDNGFWPAARGGMHIKINNGVLRKFNTLSKVFSILNVAQLFKGQLPDMDREGMPFSLMEGSVTLAEGRASTEDLKIYSDAMNMSMVGWQGIIEDNMDFTLGIMPLGTVDKVMTSIPIAGWVLTGENKAFLTAYFKMSGSSENPNVNAIPIDSLSDTVLGVFRRTFGLPGKLIKDIKGLFQEDAPKKVAP